jgi:sarcosine oxidase subunit alpha
MNVRLPESRTQIINRQKPIKFTYQGNAISAYEGDTVASALYATGVREMAVSFKYHRPRGLFDLGVHAAEPTMRVDDHFNTRIARTLAFDGAQVEPQFKAGVDFFKLADKASSVLGVGFYYKSKVFCKSRRIWDKAREMMRSAPGNLGKIGPPRTSYKAEEINLTPDVLVVGGGEAGLSAAITAAEADVRVVLVEADPFLGGCRAFQGEEAYDSIQDLVIQARRFHNLTILTSATAASLYSEGLVVCVQSCHSQETFIERSYLIRPHAMVVATGAMDRPLMFNHNDRPGVMLPQTAQRLIHLYGVKPAERAVVAGGDDDIYQVALDLVMAGCKVPAVVDIRSGPPDAQSADKLVRLGVELCTGHVVVQVKGKKMVNGIDVALPDGTGKKSWSADAIFAACGRTGLFKLIAQTDAQIVYNRKIGMHLPANLPPAYQCAGKIMGLSDSLAIRAQGRLAGAQALGHLGLDVKTRIRQAKEELASAPASPPNPEQPRSVGGKERCFVCLGNDVTQKDIDTALSEGFGNSEMIKRYTTATMGAEQGSISQINFIDYLAASRPELMGERCITTPRPPLVGISMGVMAAGLHDQPRITPLHQVQLEMGGKPLRVGPWIRIEDFGEPEKESLAVRRTAAMCDVSTLGKFRLQGPDAHSLFNKVNTKSINSLAGGKILYFAAMNEEAVFIDDGIAVKLGENDYYFTASSSRGPLIREWYQRWQREYGYQANIADLTDAFAGMNLAGPHARKILSKLVETDISNQALPFMGWIKTQVSGVDAMIFRMGFLGELSYEIHCPASYAPHLWQSLIQAGTEHGLVVAGLETQLTCRLEKGHALPGLDTDGNTNLIEANMHWLRDKGRYDMVGGPMLKFFEDRPLRDRVVAFSLDGRTQVHEGYIVVSEGRMGRVGHVTSVRFSATMGKTLGLALVGPHKELEDKCDLILMGGGQTFNAQQVETPFYDPKGERMKK